MAWIAKVHEIFVSSWMIKKCCVALMATEELAPKGYEGKEMP